MTVNTLDEGAAEGLTARALCLWVAYSTDNQAILIDRWLQFVTQILHSEYGAHSSSTLMCDAMNTPSLDTLEAGYLTDSGYLVCAGIREPHSIDPMPGAG